MKRKLLLIPLLPLLLVLAVSCASAPYRGSSGDIEKILTAINKGDALKMTELCRTPFLLDEEIIIRGSDLSELWTGLYSRGFRPGNYIILDTVPLNGESIALFSERWDISAFFRNYLSENSFITRISSDQGEFLLITAKKKRAIPELVGFKGPL